MNYGKHRSHRLSLVTGSLLVAMACLACPAVKQSARRNELNSRLVEETTKHHQEEVHALFVEGADPNALMNPPPFAWSDLLQAVLHIVKPRGHGETVLMYAAHRCDDSMLRTLLEAGGDIHDCDMSGSTALGYAVLMGTHRNVRLLVQYGGDANGSVQDTNSDTTPLLRAVEDGEEREHRPEYLAFLLAWGADPNGRSRNGNFPLMSAAVCGDLESVHVLLKAGATINARDSCQTTALMAVAEDGGIYQVQMLALLLKAGADPSLRDQKGKTAEDLAADNGYTRAAQFLHTFRPHQVGNKYSISVNTDASTGGGDAHDEGASSECNDSRVLETA